MPGTPGGESGGAACVPQNGELVKYCREHDILTSGLLAPLAHARETSNEAVKAIAAKHNKEAMPRSCCVGWLSRIWWYYLKSVTPVASGEHRHFQLPAR